MLPHSKRTGKSLEREKRLAQARSARAIARVIRKSQGRAARWLGWRFEALPLRLRKLCLLLFCLAFGGASGWLLLQAALPLRPAPPQQQRNGPSDSLSAPDTLSYVPF